MNEQSKSIWKSKTFWVNFFAFVAFVLQSKYGFVFDEEMQAQALMLINIVLRAVTKEPIAWKKEVSEQEPVPVKTKKTRVRKSGNSDKTD